MSLRSFYVIFGIMWTVQLLVEASPPMNIRKLYESASESRNNKDDLSFPQPDEDVLELEQLKQKAIENIESAFDVHENLDDTINQDDILPSLQKQLETAKIKNILNLGQPEEEELTMVQHYRPEMITTIPPTRSAILKESPPNQEQTRTQYQETQNNEKLPPIKSFYGAARLTFGQNPEVFATQTTGTTIPTDAITSSINLTSTQTTILTPISSIITGTTKSTIKIDNESSLSSENDSVSAELEATKNGERRSVGVKTPSKNAENLLKNKDGQYSAFDMAQYVFWTGDEAGVARAVEEFIQEGLMSRENAIKFLRDIRLGIEYLQNSYTNRVLPLNLKRSADNINTPKIVSPTTTKTPTTVKPLINDPEIQISNPKLISNLRKALEESPSYSMLQGIEIEQNKKNNIDYDEVSGRMRLADFLYAEYSLEEVIYQLAKVMFSQSLTHGSEQAQRALQRLTGFLESEGERGRISPTLQKKILDVLLTALSDTLAEHPDLLASARIGLGNSFHKIPQNALESGIKN